MKPFLTKADRFTELFTRTGMFITFLITLLIIQGCTLEEDPTDYPDDRDAFTGTWNVTESCSKDAYTVEIIKDPSNSSQVIIKNFWHIPVCSNPPYAIIAGNSLYMPSQSICSNNFEVNGSGNLNKGKINMTYNVNDGADLYSCQATYVRP